MVKVSCRVEERYVNPLFEVFDGGDFILSSYRDIESDRAEMSIYFEEATPERIAEAKTALSSALEIVGLSVPLETAEVADEDWKFAYRRHFKTEAVGSRLMIVPEWEYDAAKAQASGRECIILDPGMAFGTGKHETTRACLEFIDELAPKNGDKLSMIDMGCGSGILSIAAKKLGYDPVVGFDVDAEAVDASLENAAKNGVSPEIFRFALGRAANAATPPVFANRRYDLTVANILGPLLIRFAAEIDSFVGKRLVISGILSEIYAEVLSTYQKLGYREVSRKTLGEWSTGLLEREGGES